MHCVEVIQVTPVFLEAVRCGQRFRVVAQMVLAELAGAVAQIVQNLGDCRRTGSQIGGTSGQLRGNHARAQWIHSGDKGVAPGCAALHGIVGREHPALLCETVDVGCFTKPYAAVVNAHLHPADVIAHYK